MLPPHLQQLLALLAKGHGSLDLPGGRATVRAGRLQFAPPEARGLGPEASRSEVAVARPGHYAWSSRELDVIAGRGDGLVVDLSRAPFLHIRHRVAGAAPDDVGSMAIAGARR